MIGTGSMRSLMLIAQRMTVTMPVYHLDTSLMPRGPAAGPASGQMLRPWRSLHLHVLQQEGQSRCVINCHCLIHDVIGA